MKIFLFSFSVLSHHRAYGSRTRRFARISLVAFQHYCDTFGRSLVILSLTALRCSNSFAVSGYVPLCLLLYSCLPIDRLAISIYRAWLDFVCGSLSFANSANITSAQGFLITHLTDGIPLCLLLTIRTATLVRDLHPIDKEHAWHTKRLPFSDSLFYFGKSLNQSTYFIYPSIFNMLCGDCSFA